MKQYFSIVFVVCGYSFLINCSANNLSADNLKNRLFHRSEDCYVLRRAETVRALADHPILAISLTNIRADRKEPQSTLLNRDCIHKFIVASSRLATFTAQIDSALAQPTTTELEILLHSVSAFGNMDYDERKLLWLMMDPAMIARLRAVQDRSVQLKLADIFNKCPAIEFFAGGSSTPQ